MSHYNWLGMTKCCCITPPLGDGGLQLHIRHQHIMVAQVFHHPVELLYPEMMIGKYEIDPERGGKTRKSAAHAKAFFQESIMLLFNSIPFPIMP